jgi:hypothetical protein
MSQVNTTHLLLANYPEQVQELAEALAALLRKHMPGVQETPDVSAKVIGYGFSNKYADTPCAIILSQKGVKLGFYKGTELPDPAGLLEGSGKVHKYVAIKTRDDIAKPAVAALIKAAYKAYKERKK